MVVVERRCASPSGNETPIPPTLRTYISLNKLWMVDMLPVRGLSLETKLPDERGSFAELIMLPYEYG